MLTCPSSAPGGFPSTTTMSPGGALEKQNQNQVCIWERDSFSQACPRTTPGTSPRGGRQVPSHILLARPGVESSTVSAGTDARMHAFRDGCMGGWMDA